MTPEQTKKKVLERVTKWPADRNGSDYFANDYAEELYDEKYDRWFLTEPIGVEMALEHG